MVGQPQLLQLRGAVTLSPVVSGPVGTGVSDVAQLYIQQAYSGSKSGRPTVMSTDGAPFVVPLEGIAGVRFLLINTNGITMKVKLTSVNGGADQVVAVSSLLIVEARNVGDEITAIKIVGQGSLSYLIAGDT